MQQDAIFGPMGALALLTMTVLALVPLRRMAAARAGKVSAEDFRYGESAKVPGEVAVANRNYMNLLELPMLFYVAALMYYAAGRVDGVALTLAWGYVVVRAAHSYIHLTYNNVLHRMNAFGASIAVLAALWVWFFITPWVGA